MQDFDPTGLPSHGTASYEEAKVWYLERLLKGQYPRTHPARSRYFPRTTWQARLAQWESAALDEAMGPSRVIGAVHRTAEEWLQHPQGKYLSTVPVIEIVKIGDSAAYFVGRAIGRHPLSPVSPKKTWEGSAASLAASIATAYAFGHLVLEYDTRAMVGFAVVADLSGQGGDLLESYLKRVLGAKD